MTLVLIALFTVWFPRSDLHLDRVSRRRRARFRKDRKIARAISASVASGGIETTDAIACLLLRSILMTIRQPAHPAPNLGTNLHYTSLTIRSHYHAISLPPLSCVKHVAVAAALVTDRSAYCRIVPKCAAAQPSN